MHDCDKKKSKLLITDKWVMGPNRLDWPSEETYEETYQSSSDLISKNTIII